MSFPPKTKEDAIEFLKDVGALDKNGKPTQDPKSVEGCGTFEVTVVGTPVSGHEEDYFRAIDFSPSYGISQLVGKATKMESVDWSEVTAFEYIPEKNWSRTARAFRKRTGLKFPPIYKVKFRVEAVMLSKREIAAYWTGLNRRYKVMKLFRKKMAAFEEKQIAGLGIPRDEFLPKYRVLHVHKSGVTRPKFELVENNQEALKEFFAKRGDPAEAHWHLQTENK